MSIGNIYISGVIGEDISDVDVIRQVKSLPEDTSELHAFITSPGGSIDIGFSIHNYLKTLEIPVHTFARGNCDSIATVIFQAGDKRFIEENIQSFTIHNANIELFGILEANDLEQLGKELKKEEDRITKFYSEKTGLKFQTLDNLMDRETILNSEEVLKLGFADAIYSEMKAAAKIIRKKLENETKKTMSWESKLNDIWKHVTSKSKAESEHEEDDDKKNIFFLKLADGTEAYVDAPDGDFMGKRITRVENGNITDTPLPDGVHELGVGGAITVEGGVVTELTQANTEEQNDKNTMNEDQIKTFIAEQFESLKTELLAALGKEKEELFSENEEKQAVLTTEYTDLKNMLRSAVTEFNVKGNAGKAANSKNKEDDLLTVASSANIRKLRKQIKERQSN